MSEKIAKNLRYDYFNAVINKDISFFDEKKTGDLGKQHSYNQWPIGSP
jgi:ABC-type bacteriocin/lantibiotic exporter with double-glycine peptidase domain